MFESNIFCFLSKIGLSGCKILGKLDSIMASALCPCTVIQTRMTSFKEKCPETLGFTFYRNTDEKVIFYLYIHIHIYIYTYTYTYTYTYAGIHTCVYVSLRMCMFARDLEDMYLAFSTLPYQQQYSSLLC